MAVFVTYLYQGGLLQPQRLFYNKGPMLLNLVPKSWSPLTIPTKINTHTHTHTKSCDVTMMSYTSNGKKMGKK